jgi:hypothetical protein
MSASDWRSGGDFEESDGGRRNRGRHRFPPAARHQFAVPGQREGDEAASEMLNREHPNADLEGQPCRAPDDLPEYVEEGIVNDFPSIFVMDMNASTDGIDIGKEDLKHCWDSLTELIENNLSEGRELASIVDQVYDYYERCVRSSFSDAPVWPKSSIARYILRNSPHARERQCDAVIDSVFAIINLLRNNAASQHRETGEITPHGNNIKTLLGAAKTHAALVDARAKRLKLTNQ